MAPEAEVLSSYLRAASCVVLKASPEEKAQLVAGMPFVDRRVMPASQESYLLNDLKRTVEMRMRAETFLYDMLPRRCPKSSQQLAFHSAQLDARTQKIYESHFADLVAVMLAVNISSPEDLRRSFEMEHAAIGIEESTY